MGDCSRLAGAGFIDGFETKAALHHRCLIIQGLTSSAQKIALAEAVQDLYRA